MNKIFVRRAFFLTFAFLGLYQALDGLGTLDPSQVFVRFSITPLALAFFALTFMVGNNAPKAAALAMVFLGSAMTFGGFGFSAMEQPAGILVGTLGIILIGVSARRLEQALYP